jgi:FKBP-type peptidyl-prolyl cis-trans isomerase 2
MEKSFILLGLLFLPFLLFGCLEPNTLPDTGKGTQTTGNLTAQYGDTLTVDYTLRVNGTALDTSQINVAKAEGIYDPTRSYGPFTFNMLLNGQLIPGFVNGILGMQVGESKNFTVAPADGYGLVDPSKISTSPRYYNKSIFEQTPRSYFDENNITVEVDKVFPSEFGYISIHNFTNDTVTIRYLASAGHQFTMFGIPQTVINVTNETMLLRTDMEANNTYMMIDIQTGAQMPLRVTHADNETITVDDNHPLAGKELDYEVIVRSISKQ